MPMKDSQKDDAWLHSVVSSNPIHIAPATKNIITCPVRLRFLNVDKPTKAQDAPPDAKASYNLALLFPPNANDMIKATLAPWWLERIKQEFPTNIGADGVPFGLQNPFHDQREKQQFTGMTPGAIYLSSVGSQFKPQIVDTANNPIIDPSRIYEGVWAIVALNMFKYKNKKSGVSFGLAQNIMLFADDTSLGMAGAAPKDDFAGVNIDNAYNPAAAFGNTAPTAPAAAAPMSILPPSTPVVPAAPSIAGLGFD